MTVVPVDELDNIPACLQAAIEANDRNTRAMTTCWLDDQSIRNWISKLGFDSTKERRMIIEAWAAVGRSARTARGQGSNALLAAIQFGPHSPPGASDLAPTISAADFDMVINTEALLEHVRCGHEDILRDEAVEACEQFLRRLRTHLHH